MKKVKLFFALASMIAVLVSCDKGREGCLDPEASNYDPLADKYGPCEYDISNDDSCGTADMIPVFIHIEAEVKGTPLVLESIYTDSMNRQLSFNTFKYYVANVQLVDGEFAKSEIVKTELIDLETRPPSIPGSPTWDQTIEGHALPGTYDKVYMGFGVDPELNEEYRPNDYPIDHALNSTYSGMGWSWRAKYKYSLIDGVIDSTGNNSLDHSFFMHTGFSDLYRFNSFSLNVPITMELGKTYHLYFKQDVLRAFSGMDIATNEGRTHTATEEQKKYAIMIQENLSQSLTFSRYTVQ